MNSNSGIQSIAIFGSFGRGNADAFSDLDVLVLCRDGAGTQPETLVRSLVAQEFRQPPSISWYGNAKMTHFFTTGDLFAWHLYRESFPLVGFPSLVEMFGEPAPYLNCMTDIQGLAEILSTVEEEINSSPQNLVYEMGLAYVCLRNIAMTASSALSERVDFGRFSPFNLPAVEPPISLNDYKLLAQCRHASTRGTSPPELDIDVTRVLHNSLSWARSIERMAL